MKTYAKINLGLNVVPKNFRYTTKHQIESIFILVDNFYDEIDLDFNQRNEDVVNYYDKNEKRLVVQNCLIQQTLCYLRSKYDLKNHYIVRIKKNIPFGAGLGGGSSNAAAVIKLILERENIPIDLLDYKEIALMLGSDIPFFLSGYSKAYVSGFGDVVEPLKFHSHLKFNIHLLKINVHTKYIFDAYISHIQKTPTTDFQKVIKALKENTLPENLYNQLQDTCFKMYPQIYEKYCEIKNKHDLCIMTGSGSSLITIDKTPRVRTRYAPSPTGFFHIGGARTALFNYIFAKKHHGDFVLRIEDTDIERNVKGGIESQIENLKWMQITPDESIQQPGLYGPYQQSQKIERYQELAYKLLREGLAYRCFCTKEQLDLDRANAEANHQTPRYQRHCLHLTQDQINEKLTQNLPFTIRLKIDDNKTYTWNDMVRGEISVPGSAMTDPVILKSNGYPMYNFAVVVDDFDMEINYVLRGEEHISNTPYQLAITDALGKERSIKYGHLSVIVDASGKKLSKRNKELKQFIEDYRKMGYLPQAMDNFLVLLGWSPENNVEIFKIDDIVDDFLITDVSKAPTFFDEKKLAWIGNEHFKLLSSEEYLKFVRPFVTRSVPDEMLLLFQNQISYAKELDRLIEEIFFSEEDVSPEMMELLRENLDVVRSFRQKIMHISTWNDAEIKEIIDAVKVETKKKGKNLFMPIRIAATKMMHGPELHKCIYLFGQNRIMNNLNHLEERLNHE